MSCNKLFLDNKQLKFSYYLGFKIIIVTNIVLVSQQLIGLLVYVILASGKN